MSYVDEVYDYVVEKNPAQPEFHQAVKEVMTTLRPVIERNEENSIYCIIIVWFRVGVTCYSTVYKNR